MPILSYTHQTDTTSTEAAFFSTHGQQPILALDQRGDYYLQPGVKS